VTRMMGPSRGDPESEPVHDKLLSLFGKANYEVIYPEVRNMPSCIRSRQVLLWWLAVRFMPGSHVASCLPVTGGTAQNSCSRAVLTACFCYGAEPGQPVLWHAIQLARLQGGCSCEGRGAGGAALAYAQSHAGVHALASSCCQSSRGCILFASLVRG
jgi:hypothetical protein